MIKFNKTHWEGKDFYTQPPLLCIIELSEGYNYMFMETIL